jgi:hypothetical protein
MTMRYADISEPTGLSIPNIPALPIGMVSSPIGTGDDISMISSQPIRENAGRIDIKPMEQENFDPEACTPLSLESSNHWLSRV